MSLVPAAGCTTMAEVRAGVDDIDRRLVALLAERLGYMDAAARVKTDRATVRDEERKSQVIANAVAEARRVGLPEDLPPIIWEALVEYSITHEMGRFDAKS